MVVFSLVATSRPSCVATVLTACGIETCHTKADGTKEYRTAVATVLTACGIETYRQSKTIPYRRCLPLQQYLPLAVLKRIIQDANKDSNVKVATVLTACGIETVINL